MTYRPLGSCRAPSPAGQRGSHIVSLMPVSLSHRSQRGMNPAPAICLGSAISIMGTSPIRSSVRSSMAHAGMYATCSCVARCSSTSKRCSSETASAFFRTRLSDLSNLRRALPHLTEDDSLHLAELELHGLAEFVTVDEELTRNRERLAQLGIRIVNPRGTTPEHPQG